MSLANAALQRVPPGARRLIRRAGDPLLAPIGSVRGARTTDRVMALTFDDGPDPDVTPRVLDALAAAGARATFFLLVEQAQANDALVARIVADGHEVGLHGLDHRRLTRMAVADLAGHIRAGRHALEAVVGRPLRWFRPPFGSQSFASWRAALAVGLTPVVWSIDVQDWIDQPPEVLVSRARRDAACGGILLLHDLLASDPDDPTTEASTGFDRAATIGAVVSGLRSDGWDLTSVGDLLRGRRVWRSVWFRRV